MFLLQRGRVREEEEIVVSVCDEDGAVPATGCSVVATHVDGDYFGETELLTNQLRSTSAVAETRCLLFSISREDVEDMVVRAMSSCRLSCWCCTRRHCRLPYWLYCRGVVVGVLPCLSCVFRLFSLMLAVGDCSPTSRRSSGTCGAA
jgi:hypothetical protein